MSRGREKEKTGHSTSQIEQSPNLQFSFPYMEPLDHKLPSPSLGSFSYTFQCSA